MEGARVENQGSGAAGAEGKENVGRSDIQQRDVVALEHELGEAFAESIVVLLLEGKNVLIVEKNFRVEVNLRLPPKQTAGGFAIWR